MFPAPRNRFAVKRWFLISAALVAIALVTGSLATADPPPAGSTVTVIPDPQSVTYGDAAPANYTFTLKDENGGTVNPSDLSGYSAPSCTATYSPGDAAGTIPITCSGGGSGFNDFGYEAGDLTVAKRSLTVTADDVTSGVTYGDAEPASFSFTVGGDGFYGADDWSVDPACGSDYAQGDSAGSAYTITCSGGDPGGNYEVASYVDGGLTVAKRSLTVTADDKSVKYGSSAPAYTFTVGGDGFYSTDTWAASGTPVCSSDYTPSTSVSNSPRSITCSGGNAGGNYEVTPYAAGSLTVTKRLLTVTADDKSVKYGSSAPAYTFTLSGDGFTSGQKWNDDGKPRCTSTYTTTTSVSSSPVAITCSGGNAGGNYTVAYVPGSLTITKATLYARPDAKSVSYGSPAPGYTSTIWTAASGGTQVVTSSVAGYVAPVCTSAYTTSTVPSALTISCLGGSSTNYTFNTTATATLTVTKRSLVVTADNKTVTFGSAAPGYTFTVGGDGFKSPDTWITAPTCTSTYTTTTSVSSSPVAITCSGGNAGGNYTISYAPGSLTVTKATLFVRPDAKTVSSGSTAPTYTFTIWTAASGGTQVVTSSIAGYVAPTCTSTYTKTTAPSTLTIRCSGGSSTNYTFNTTATATLTVTAR